MARCSIDRSASLSLQHQYPTSQSTRINDPLTESSRLVSTSLVVCERDNEHLVENERNQGTNGLVLYR